MSDELDKCWEALLPYMNMMMSLIRAAKKWSIYPEWELDEHEKMRKV